MRAQTRALAWIWLGLAGAGLAGCVFVVSASATEPYFVEVVLLATFVWSAPLIAGCLALFRGRPYGRWVLMVHAGLGCLVWLFACLAILDGPPSIGIAAVAVPMLAFSVLTIVWLIRDPPSKWAAKDSGP
jgi:hypothetical protein